eukprot:1392823-Amorphochlora_amoeboformis.AAC.1
MGVEVGGSGCDDPPLTELNDCDCHIYTFNTTPCIRYVCLGSRFDRCRRGIYVLKVSLPGAYVVSQNSHGQVADKKSTQF